MRAVVAAYLIADMNPGALDDKLRIEYGSSGPPEFERRLALAKKIFETWCSELAVEEGWEGSLIEARLIGLEKILEFDDRDTSESSRHHRQMLREGGESSESSRDYKPGWYEHIFMVILFLLVIKFFFWLGSLAKPKESTTYNKYG